MKNVFFLLFALMLITVPACKKNDDGSTFSCKIDGEDFKVSGFGAYATDFSTSFTIYGVDDWENSPSANVLYLSLPLGSGPGTYTLNTSDQNGYYIDASGKAFSTLWGDGTGTLVIEEIDDKHVKGTFEYTPYDADTETQKKAITGGKFDVAFR